MTGLRQRAGAAMFQARGETCSGGASRKPRTSPPLEKCPPPARNTMTRTRASASSASNTARNCSRSAIVMTLSGARSRITSARSRAGSISRRKPSKISRSAGNNGAGSVISFPPILTGHEKPPQDLADRRFRDLGDEHIIARSLVIGEARRAAPGIERRRLDRNVSIRDALNESGDALAPPLVRHSHDRHLGDRRMQGQHVLDVGGRHVLASGYDHVVDPAGDEEIALRIEIAGVAGEIPAVMPCTGIGVGASPIAFEYLVARSVGDDLTLLASRRSRIGTVGAELDDPDPLVQSRLAGRARLRRGARLGREGVDLGGG